MGFLFFLSILNNTKLFIVEFLYIVQNFKNQNFMKIKLLFIIALSIVVNATAQIGFENHTIIDDTNQTLNTLLVEMADLDGDGDLDALSVSTGDDKIAWYENMDGLGTFGSQQVITVDAYSSKFVKTGDFDGDGDLDVLSKLNSDKIVWFENLDGLGSFGSYTIVSDSIDNGYTGYVADMDGDGDLDIYCAGTFTDNIVWFENLDGQGNFSIEKEIINDIDGANSAFTADFDTDGDLDIVFSAGIDDKVSWIENLDGLGNFGPENLISSTMDSPRFVFAADIDGDGAIDVVSSSAGDDKILWYKNLDGQGSFGAGQLITSNALNPYSIYITDIDGDSDMDVISASSGDNKIAWYINTDGQGNFSGEQIIKNNAFNTSSVISCDVDNDGDLDVLTACDNRIGWFQNIDGQGNFTSMKNITATAYRPTKTAIFDVDNDGDMDVLSGSSLSWYENLDSEGDFGQQNVIDVLEINFIETFDLDQDGNVDIFVGDERDLYWYKNETQGNFTKRLIEFNFFDRLFFKSAFVADLDGDGDMDVLRTTGIDNKLLWHENLGNSTFSNNLHVINSESQASHNFVYSADVDGDGDMDVIFSYYGYASGNGIKWYRNNDGLGHFILAQSLDGPFNDPNATKTADLDGDGDLDLYSSFDSFDKISWYENLDGLGNFSTQKTIHISGPFASSASTASAKDVDHDGDLDIISASENLKKVVWYENVDGFGNFGPQQTISTSINYPSSISSADFNNDGSVDVLSAAYNEDKLVWHENLNLLSNQINGIVRRDLNANGCDTQDKKLKNMYVVAQNGANSFATFTNQNGVYQLFPDDGQYEVALINGIPTYFNSSPNLYNFNFPGIGNIEVGDFCIEPVGSINDLNISIYPLNEPRPGSGAFYELVYNNIGTTTLSGTISYTFDDSKLTFSYATETVSSQTDNTIIFDYSDLDLFESRSIKIFFDIAPPPVVEIGDVIIGTATINPIIGDYTESDNTFHLEQTVVGSYDPNDIQVLEGDEIFLDETENYLHYIIRFQNTGTASAINVKITNQLDPNLDWNTIQLENVSHSNRVEITNGNEVEFIFDNINLPDINTNEPESHGYIQYKIKPINTIEIGDSMSNNAEIYFDFNPPIGTNTVTTTVVEELGIEENKFANLVIYPNPSKEILNIKTSKPIINISIFNQLGQLILEESNAEGINSINIEKLNEGIYFVKLKTNNSEVVIKKLIKK